jgi:surface protein
MHIFTPPTQISKVTLKLLALATLLILQSSSLLLAQDAPFITIWQTDNEGTSEDNQITIPGQGVDYLIEWEEVDNEANNNGSETGSHEHIVTFPKAGKYRVKLSGSFHRIVFNNTDNDKLIDIAQWGDIEWSSFSSAFSNCSNLIQTATDKPDLSNVNSLSTMFVGAESFNADLSDWDVSNISAMKSHKSFSQL